LPPASIGIDFDPGGLIVQDHAPGEAAQQLADHIVSVRACDAVRDLAQSRGVPVQLGRGTVDFAEIFSVLERNQFSGYTVIEGAPPDPVRQSAEAIEYLKSLF
jgi:sugar phosphate isomerase/epimerase